MGSMFFQIDRILDDVLSFEIERNLQTCKPATCKQKLLLPILQNPINIPDPNQSGWKSKNETRAGSDNETGHPVYVKMVSSVIYSNTQSNKK